MIEARPLPIRNIALTLMLLAFISLVSQYLGLRAIHGLGLIVAFVAILGMLLYHAWLDNTRTTYRNLRSLPTIGLAFVVWIPFVIVLLPGILATLFIDDSLDSVIRFAEKSAAGSIETIDEQIEDTIQTSEAVNLSWWWPPDWVKQGTKIVERKVLRTVQRDVLHPAPFWIRFVFAFVYSIMRVSQLVLYSTLAFIGIRSFVFLLARTALWRRTEIEFSLP